MKKQIVLVTLLLLLLASITAVSGCDYITGTALGDTQDNTGATVTTPPRWVWSSVNDTYHPSTIVDRYTGELINDVTPYEAFGIMGTSSYLGNPVVIDVRTPQEFAGGHLWRVINIDYSSPTFTDEISKLEKNFTYIVYCQAGGRSASACQMMRQLGFKRVINMTGGYAAWVTSELPIEK